MTIEYGLAEFTRGIQKLLSTKTNLETTIKIAFEDGTVIYIDGRSLPHEVSNLDEPADVTLRMTLKTLNRLYRRELHPALAVTTGKIRIEGDILQAMKLGVVLQPFA